MRNANGFGSCIKLSGSRRNPWAARITVGWTEKGYPKYRYLGYFKTKKEAFQCLVEHSSNPESFAPTIAFCDLYDRWKEDADGRIRHKTMTMYTSGYNVLSDIHKMYINRIRLDDIQQCMDRSGKNAPMLRWVKTLCVQMYEYGVQHELVPEAKRAMVEHINYSKYGNPNKKDRTPFTHDEIQKLWDNVNTIPGVDYILILLYTGVRVSELLECDLSHFYLEDKYFFIEDGKTASATREVPLHDDIIDFVRNRVQNQTINVSYTIFRRRIWQPVMEALGMEHTVHETRHTFISRMTELGVDPRILKQIVGHSSSNVTESVYTHISVEKRLEAVNQLVY